MGSYQYKGGLLSTENEAAIKVIVELQAKPGKRAELKSLLESIVAQQGPNQHGFLGSTRYEVPENPDMLVEIADWESAEGADGAHAGGCGCRRLHAADGAAGRAVQSYGHQAAALKGVGVTAGDPLSASTWSSSDALGTGSTYRGFDQKTRT